MEELNKYTILVVDDEEDLRSTIVFDLRRKGFLVLEAENGKTAFELVKSNHIDLVLSDIRMPGGDGVTLLEQVKARNSELPAVILTTGFSEISEADCKKKGAACIMEKPFDRKLLIKSVYESLGLPTPI